MASFADRVVLITGAGSGIGRELARVLAAEGAKIAALDRRADFLDGLAVEMKGKPVACATADVTDLAAVRAAVAQLEATLGPTDILIASAGIGLETSALAYRGEDVASQVNVNLIGVSNTIDAVLPGMRRRRAGHLVALSSLASYRGLPLMAGYCASKAGLNALFDALRVELAPLGIATTTLCPGWVRTPLTDAVNLRGVRMMEVSVAVRRMAAAIRARRPFVAFPARTTWQVRLLRHLPRPVADWMAAQMLKRFKR